MADPKPAQNRIAQNPARTVATPVTPPEEPEIVESSVDPMEARLAEMEARFEARARAAEEEVKRIKEEAQVRIAAAEAMAKAQVAEAQRVVTAATSPAAQNLPVKVSAQSKEDVEVLCLKTQLLGARAGGRTYQFVQDEVISMDPSHAVEYEAAGWVKRLKGNRR